MWLLVFLPPLGQGVVQSLRLIGWPDRWIINICLEIGINRSGLFSCPAILPYCHSVCLPGALYIFLSVCLSVCLFRFLTSCWHSKLLLFWLLSWNVFLSYLSFCISICVSACLSDILLTLWTTFVLTTKLKSLCLFICLSVTKLKSWCSKKTSLPLENKPSLQYKGQKSTLASKNKGLRKPHHRKISKLNN